MHEHKQQPAPTDSPAQPAPTILQALPEISGANFRDLPDADLQLVIAGTIYQPNYPNLQRGLRYVLKPTEASGSGEVFEATGPVRPSRCYALSFSGMVNNRRETMYSDVFEAGYSLRLIAFVEQDSFEMWSEGKRIGNFLITETPQSQSDVTAEFGYGHGQALDRVIRTIESDRLYVRRYFHAQLTGSVAFAPDYPNEGLAGRSVEATLSAVGVASNIRLPIQDSTREKPGHRAIKSSLCLSQLQLLSCDVENPQPLARAISASAFVHPDLPIFNRPLSEKITALL